MLFNLLVWKLEHLQTIWISCLSCLCLSKVVHNLLVCVCLLDIAVIEVNNCVAIREGLSTNAIAKNDFFFSINVSTLDFAIIADNLVLNLRVWLFFIMVLVWELHFIIFFFVVKVLIVSVSWQIRCFIFFLLSYLILILVIHLWQVGKWVVSAMQAILRVITPRNHIGSSIVFLVLYLLFLVLELFNTCLSCLSTLSTLLLGTCSCIWISSIAILSLHTTWIAWAAPV